MKFVSICGGIGHGKSTIAEYLVSIDPEHSLHVETSQVVTELANPFNKALRPYVDDIKYEDQFIPVANQALEVTLPLVSGMAEHPVSIDELRVVPSDIELHPEWYEKLFDYLHAAYSDPTLLDETITPANKNRYRPLLQWIGGYVLYRLDNNFLWYEELFRRAGQAKDIGLVAMTAPRQPAEAEFVQAHGGKVLKVINPRVSSDTSDVTERKVAAIQADADIFNNGTLEELQVLAGQVRRDVMAGTLQSRYEARSL